jgi:predicted nuclease of predicted toxin-antitoxin system
LKLLLDENLSPRLLHQIGDLFSNSLHVRTVGLKQKPDRKIWDFARANGFAILTADADFSDLAVALGQPPKVILLKGCDYGNEIAEKLIRSQAIRIADFLDDPERAVLILTQKRPSRSSSETPPTSAPS